MYPIQQYIDSLNLSSSRMRTLRRLFIVSDSRGDEMFTVWPRGVSFRVDIEGRLYNLKCVGDAVAAHNMAHLDVPTGAPFVEWRWLPMEMTVVDSSLHCHQVDVALEQLPEGMRLDNFVLRASREQIAQALEQLVLLSQRLADEGFVHGNIKPADIVVGRDMTMYLVNYQLARRDECVDDDNLALASIAMALYLYATARNDIKTDLFVRRNLLAALRRMPSSPLGEMLLAAKNLLPDRMSVNSRLRTLVMSCGKSDKYECYDEMGEMRDMMRVVMCDGRFSYIDANGTAPFAATFDYAEDFSRSRAVVACGEFFAMIDKEGHFVLPMIYDDVRWYPDAGVAVASLDGKSRMFDSHGAPFEGQYDWIGDCEQGRVAVGCDDKYGFVDYSGKVVVPLKYDNAFDFRGGVAMVERDGEQIYIDLSGCEIIPPK